MYANSKLCKSDINQPRAQALGKIATPEPHFCGVRQLSHPANHRITKKTKNPNNNVNKNRR